MNLSHVKQHLLDKEAVAFEIMPNPGALSEWVIWIRESSGKSHLLVNDDESIYRSSDANEILALLKGLGAKKLHFSL